MKERPGRVLGTEWAEEGKWRDFYGRESEYMALRFAFSDCLSDGA